MAFNQIPVIGLIPARAGSKGIKDKNIIELRGKPLIAYSIEAGIKSNFVDNVVVSSDSLNILDISAQIGATVINRPAHLATDSANINDCIFHAIQELNLEQAYIILLQATSPLRSAEHIDAAFELLKEQNAKNLVSVFEVNHHPYKSYLHEGKYLKPLISKEYLHKNRQELPNVYQPNGAIYIFTVENFLIQQRIPDEEVIPYIMPQAISIDIDTYDDLKHIEYYIEEH